ncbi:hypothetical protein HELRODRAFT_165369 [Helobdella robusta]|uniref:Uncharacterized protein n=1 Tax=Helobdella robusta TaxID=6412 RepID=T1EWN4_HELRO|nr:hypothetical protein HELRODRAFT_165369 [Helobdella robusta]ESN91345.1 hypothetical protein HELRODRAFT_165369 [Helobdella robusta]
MATLERKQMVFENVHGGFGYGERNEDGNRILEFAESHGFCLLNTYFRQRIKLPELKTFEAIVFILTIGTVNVILLDIYRTESQCTYNNLVTEPQSFVVPLQKLEEDSSDGHLTQDSNASDDTAGLGSETSFHGITTLAALKSDPSIATSTNLEHNLGTSNHLNHTSFHPYGHSADGHFFIPAQIIEEASRKRELRLLKNKCLIL